MNTSEQIPETPSNDGRNSQGKFTRGNPGGPGNPFGRQVAALRKVLLNCVTEEEMAAVGTKLLEMARAGNLQAMKLLFSYTLGKPEDTVNPDQLDMEEWGLFKQMAQIPREIPLVALVPDQSMALEMARNIRPAMTLGMGRMLQEQIQKGEESQKELEEENRLAEQEYEEYQRRRRLKRKKKIGSPVGKKQTLPAKEATAPSTNGNKPLPNGELPVGVPSTNGASGLEVGLPPSPNGFDDPPPVGNDEAAGEKLRDRLRDRFGSFFHKWKGKSPFPENGREENGR